MNIEEFYSFMNDFFFMHDGPPTSSIEIDGEKRYYVAFGFCGVEVRNSVLIKRLYQELKKHFPQKLDILLWRQRPIFTEWDRDLFTKARSISKEELEDGLADIPLGYKFDFETNSYREYSETKRMRGIYCRVWWPGLLPEMSNKPEGSAYPELTGQDLM